MKPFSLLALTVLPLLPLSAVEPGATLAEVIAEKGDPVSRMQAKDTVVLNYQDETIKLQAGKVVSVKAVSGGGESSVAPTPSGPTTAAGEWTTNYSAALAQAKGENRRIFLFFTGSDWCGWCKRLDAEVLSTSEFQAYAKKKLILVKLDFPRQVAQSSQIKQQNQQLQKQYQIEGYPSIVVLDSRGKMIGQLGYEPGGPKPFVDQLKSF